MQKPTERQLKLLHKLIEAYQPDMEIDLKKLNRDMASKRIAYLMKRKDNPNGKKLYTHC